MIEKLNKKVYYATIGHNRERWICELRTSHGFIWFTPTGWRDRREVYDICSNIKEQHTWRSKREMFASLKKDFVLYKKRIASQGIFFHYWNYKIIGKLTNEKQ